MSILVCLQGMLCQAQKNTVSFFVSVDCRAKSIHNVLSQMLFSLVDVLKTAVYDYQQHLKQIVYSFTKSEKKGEKNNRGQINIFVVHTKISQRLETRANRSTADVVNNQNTSQRRGSTQSNILLLLLWILLYAVYILRLLCILNIQ